MLRRIINKVRKVRGEPHATPEISSVRVDRVPSTFSDVKTINDWKPLDEQLYKSWIPHLLVDTPLEPSVALVNSIGPDLHHLQLFSDEGCKRLCAELDAFEAWARRYQVEVVPPNSMHRYGMILSEIGFEEPIRELCEHLYPILAPLYPELHSDRLDGHHAFLVSYSNREGDRDLGFHVDNSEVTLNLTLETHGEGGELYFHGRRCEHHRQMPHRVEEEAIVKHQLGGLLIHAGAHRHGVYPINNGRRRGIIVWLSSSAYRENRSVGCESWCGDHSPNEIFT